MRSMQNIRILKIMRWTQNIRFLKIMRSTQNIPILKVVPMDSQLTRLHLHFASTQSSQIILQFVLRNRGYLSVTSRPSNLTWVSFLQVRPKAVWRTSKYPVAGKSTFYFISKSNKPIGASPLTKCHFSHYLFWLRRILWGMGGGGLKKGGNAPRATESQRCKSSAN